MYYPRPLLFWAHGLKTLPIGKTCSVNFLAGLLLLGAGCLGVGLLGELNSVQAQLPSTQLFAISPPGGQRGVAFDLSISGGAELDGVNQLLFSHPGISAVNKISPPDLRGKTSPLDGQFTVTIAPDVPVGLHEVRAVGRFGVSNPRWFVVGLNPEVPETRPNNTPEQAMPLEFNNVVNATADGSNYDWYKITAQAGQRILIDCQASRIDSRLDPILTIQDSSGKELAKNYRKVGRDPLLDFTAPAAGEYLLRVNDFVYGGGAEHFYRLTARIGPYIDFIYPPSGLPGTTSEFTLYGRNLPGGTPAPGVVVQGVQLEQLKVSIAIPAGGAEQKLQVRLPIQSPGSSLDAMEYVLETPQGPSNPVLLGFAGAPVVLEQEPNNDSVAPQAIPVPSEFVGQFHPRGDYDFVQFEAKKGTSYWIEVISQQANLPTDPLVVVQRVVKDAAGKETLQDLVEQDDNARASGGLNYNVANSDPSFALNIPEDGLYRVMIRDLYNDSHADPRYVYRLRIRPPQPSFRLAVVPVYPSANPAADSKPWNPLLRRGGTEVFQVLAFRQEGFNESIEVVVEGLPGGVTALPIVIAPGQESGLLVLEAADSVAAFAGNIRVLGKAQVNGQPLVQEARAGTVVWPIVANKPTGAQARVTQGIVLGVSALDMMPFTVHLGEGQNWEMSRAGKLEIPIKVIRRAGYKEPVTIVPQQLPPNVTSANVTINGDQVDGKLVLDVKPNANVGAFTILTQAQAKISYRRNPEVVVEATAAKVEFDKLATDTAAALQAATLAKQAGDKAAVETDTKAKAAAAAKVVSDKLAVDTDTKAKAAAAAKGGSDKLAVDTDAAAKAAAAAKVVSDKAIVDTAAAAKAAADAKVMTDKLAAETDITAKAAAAAKGVVDQAVVDSATAAKTAADAAAKAKEAADKDASNAELVKAKQAADQAAAQAAAKAKAAADAKVMVDKLAVDTAAKAKVAADAKVVVDKLAVDTATQAKAAAAAKVVADKLAVDTDTKAKAAAAAKVVTDKLAADTASAAKTAADAKVVADKLAVDTAAAAKAAADAKVAADKAMVDADAKVKAVAAAKTVADKRVTDLTAASNPKDVNLLAASTPARVTVTSAPLTMAAPPKTEALKVGTTLMVPVTITRLYGFNDPVEVEAALPAGLKGLKVTKATIPAGQNQGNLIFEAAADASVGEHAIVLKAVFKFNTQNLNVPGQTVLKVDAAQ